MNPQRALSGPAYFWGIYRANLKMTVAQMLQYRFAIMIWAVWGFVGPLISLAVWSAASAARGGSISNAATGATFSRADFAAYFILMMIFGHLTMSWDPFEFAWRVRDGNLSPPLPKPMHPIHRDVAFNIAFKLVTSVMISPAWLALILLLHPSPPRNPWMLLLAAPAVFLSGFIRYVWQYSLAVIAFWTTRVEALNQLFYTVDSFLSGRIAPLGLLPRGIGIIAIYSPFYSMGAFPVELALGRIPAERILIGFFWQIVWAAAGVALFRFM